MTFAEYQTAAMRTRGNSDLAIMGLGIAGEAGEVADEIKKVLGHGKPLDRAEIVKELGDVLWYVAGVAETTGVALETIAAINVKKLEARYPNGFVPHANRSHES